MEGGKKEGKEEAPNVSRVRLSARNVKTAHSRGVAK